MGRTSRLDDTRQVTLKIPPDLLQRLISLSFVYGKPPDFKWWLVHYALDRFAKYEARRQARMLKQMQQVEKDWEIASLHDAALFCDEYREMRGELPWEREKEGSKSES